MSSPPAHVLTVCPMIYGCDDDVIVFAVLM
jgi:hypothetical protein